MASYAKNIESGDFLGPVGNNEKKGNAVKMFTNKKEDLCNDEASKKMLWEESEKATQ